VTAVVLCLCFEAMLADDHLIREHGSHIAAQLLRSRPSRCSILVTTAEHHPSPEVRSRCGRLVPRYRAHLAAAYVPSTVPVWPCVDMVPDTFPDRWGHVSHWRCQALGEDVPPGASGPPYWWGYRRATELWVRSEIGAGLSYADADALLSRMWLQEMDYHAAGYPALLPLVWDWQRAGWQGGYPVP
jgi:hypothetical protein